MIISASEQAAIDYSEELADQRRVTTMAASRAAQPILERLLTLIESGDAGEIGELADRIICPYIDANHSAARLQISERASAPSTVCTFP